MVSSNLVQSNVYQSFLKPVSNAQINAPIIQTSIQQTNTIDTVALSTQQNSKKGLSTFAKIAIGIGTLTAGAIIARKFIPPLLVKSRCEKLFMKSFTKEEAQLIQKKYQDIMKIKDKNQFVDKLIAELRKDYQIEDIPLIIDKTFKAGSNETNAFNTLKAKALNEVDWKNGTTTIKIDINTYSKKELLKTLTHELRHTKQNKAIFQCAGLEDYRKILIQRCRNDIAAGVKNSGFGFDLSGKKKREFIKRIRNLSDEDIMQDFGEIINKELKGWNDYYTKLGISKMSPNDKNYQWARKCLEADGKNTNGNWLNYHLNFTERDAFASQDRMRNLVHNYVYNAWL